MQLPRVVIAAVFFALAALIAVPALFGDDSSEAAPASTRTTEPSPSESGPESPSPSESGSPEPSASPSGSGGGGGNGDGNTALTAEIGSVACPDRTVPVRIRNAGPKPADFSIEKNDDTAALPGRIGGGESRTVKVDVREDRRTRVRVAWANERIASETVEANCAGAGAAPGDDPSELPYTGQGDGVLWARGATAVAVLVTGLIVFWYGGVWPRRKEKMYGADK